MEEVLDDVRRLRAEQQPEWGDVEQVRRIRGVLRGRPPLVRSEDVTTLRAILARVAAGEAHVVQAGDCAEDVDERTAGNVARKVAVLDLLAGSLRMITGRPVVRIGRIAGQFAKPRSARTERVGDQEIPAYLGDMVNGPEPDADSRRPDPLRLLAGYMAANDIMDHLGWRGRGSGLGVDAPVWTSHEALLLDYEIPMVRGTDGRRFLGSTHLPWIGDRTRQPDGAHVALLAGVANPVACKVGPSMTRAEILRLCELLDPEREPGRLTLIARMGVGRIAEKLPPLVTAVRAAGHPVIWLNDPMHGNTERTPCGAKTRVVGTVAAEVRRFRQVLEAAGAVAGGLHLETTPDDVTECVEDVLSCGDLRPRYTSRCDPRLTPPQAMAVVTAWAG